MNEHHVAEEALPSDLGSRLVERGEHSLGAHVPEHLRC